ncbi:MAG TPA: type IX secretion system membrane protein PorP/SprF [Cytophagaceae bacterium]|jgi:type IX secretion system PorP/SprF family membrane protein
MRIYFSIIFIALICLSAQAQQDAQFSQYLFNGVVINPGYAGSKEYVNLNGLYRKQWVGAEGEPTSQTVSVDAPIYRNKLGIGMYVQNDVIGFRRSTGAYGTIAYRVHLTSTAKLALGASVGATQFALKSSQLTTDIENDPAISQTDQSVIRPNARVGLYFNTNRFFAGITIADILNGFNVKESFVIGQQTHFYFATGVVVGLGSFLKIRPSIIVKEDFKGPTNADFTNFFIFKEKLWLGGSYRTALLKKDQLDSDLRHRDAVALMIQVFPIERIRLGYAYDITLTDYKNFPSHEISVGYYFIKKAGPRMLTPRYF